MMKKLKELLKRGSKPAVVKEVEETEDRSAYNCGTCGGDGLLKDETLCMRCVGTGKV